MTDAPNDRRGFLKTSLALGTAGLLTGAAGSTPVAAAAPEATAGLLAGKTILFQGDSITDAGRSRPDENIPNMKSGMGNGYAWLTAAALLAAQEGPEPTIYNRGISGHKVFQLAARWQKDCLDLKPDVLSILIGVNDIWHWLNGKYDGTVETYENDFRQLLTETREQLPQTQFVICEPFVLRCGAVNDKWFPTFDQFRAVARKLSDEQQAVFVPFQSMFDKAVEYAPPEHWAGDGVHPSSFGASLMAAQWINSVRAAR